MKLTKTKLAGLCFGRSFVVFLGGLMAGGLVSAGELFAAKATGANDAADVRLLELKVDFAAPRGKTNSSPIKGTAKGGWWPWVVPDWDFYRSDLVWENGAPQYPRNSPGIANSGVHAAITCFYEGIMTVNVAGMRRFLAGHIQPQKKPVYGPICNTWIAASDFPNHPASDLLLAFYNLPPGKYRLLSYHNSFNGRRIGDHPTAVEYTSTGRPEPPMPSVRVYSVKTLLTDYFKPLVNARVKGKSYKTSADKLIVAGMEGTGKVTQTLVATNVVIQQVKHDDQLVPSVVEFTTDGSPVAVV
ncbi:MAG TPA: hypothetical protein VKA67_12110, partial [Verrucomicrobiae bacterium]|nr:hypothetical protein [Verrucomicrobiae bacterium]